MLSRKHVTPQSPGPERNKFGDRSPAGRVEECMKHVMQGKGDQQQAKNDFNDDHRGLSFTEISIGREMEGRAARLRSPERFYRVLV
jgi:hypothetical protein